MTAYYNEIDPKAAAWLRELIKRGLIADGVVDERSIIDVAPDELRDFTQCHFFAGIAVWSYALRSAGWADDRPVWTGSCPCQPFSAAGRRGGVDDERHLWPHWHHLISQCQPATIFGEQVASKDGLGWLDLVCADMEATGYAIGAADLCAAGVGAPHIRQRLFFGATRLADADSQRRDGIDPLLRQEQGDPVETSGSGKANRLADANSGQCGWLADGEGRQPDRPQTGRQQGDSEPECSGAGVGMADAAFEQRDRTRIGGAGRRSEHSDGSDPSGMADADNAGSQRRIGMSERAAECTVGASGVDGRPSPPNRVWRNSDWLFCRDGKWRPVKSGTFPLVDGTSQRMGRGGDHGASINAEKSAEARVMRLRGYGNAIVATVAQTFVESMMDAMK